MYRMFWDSQKSGFSHIQGQIAGFGRMAVSLDNLARGGSGYSFCVSVPDI